MGIRTLNPARNGLVAFDRYVAVSPLEELCLACDEAVHRKYANWHVLPLWKAELLRNGVDPDYLGKTGLLRLLSKHGTCDIHSVGHLWPLSSHEATTWSQLCLRMEAARFAVKEGDLFVVSLLHEFDLWEVPILRKHFDQWSAVALPPAGPWPARADATRAATHVARFPFRTASIDALEAGAAHAAALLRTTGRWPCNDALAQWLVNRSRTVKDGLGKTRCRYLASIVRPESIPKGRPRSDAR
jgi:hypothetical protein